ncbi:hypothetical protein HNR61_002630 [Actinomadura namibiensis]|uniref:Protein kinase domain-containing protein n=1 Tax=Actinomadura namibiensis TaxID=182080 RepID=A0A7W3QKX7_ACTNM|nr:serine/threonine-protein kinase [Actinomadura namibiensis]MBA8950999.1 hypothetical protein [Actinomadura namibiensis]
MTTHAGENSDALRPEDPRELGPYRLLSRLGRGGMGTVFLGQDPGGRRVAVKVINRELAGEPAFRDRFRREVNAARQVRRFCTAPVIDAEVGSDGVMGRDADPLYVVTEYIEGPSLERAVAERGPLPGSDLEGLAVGVATALAAIHGAGIVHRDLKPANVLLSATGPRVIDFGIARALDAADGPTRTGQLVGTPNYLPPELLRGEPVTPASDVFSWGCVVAYAGTARAPFAGNTVPEIFYKVAHEPPKLDGLDPSLSELVGAALDKDPRKRPSVQELLARLVGHTDPNPALIAETVQASWHVPGAPPVPPPPAAPAPPAATGLGRTPAGEPAPTATLGADTTRRDAAPGPVARPSRGPSRKPLLVGAGVVAAALAAVVGIVAVAGSDGPPDQLATVFSDNFSSTGSNWGGGTFTSGYGYANGVYRMDTNSTYPARDQWSPKPGSEVPQNALVSVTVTSAAGSPDSQYGLACRSNNDGKDQYAFVVRKDGKGATLTKYSARTGSKDLLTVDEVPGHKAKGPNRLQVACADPDGKGKEVRLRLWVNGEQVLDHADEQQPLANGWAGLTVRRGGNPSVPSVVDFDDFDISKVIG